MYWDITKPLKYDCIFNFIVGARGTGKTYGSKKWAIDEFMKNGSQFMYLRRYKDELRKASKFFDDIKEAYPEVKFEVKGKNFLINDKVAGYASVLSTAKIEKSTAYPKVNKIIFDEFIIDKGVYHYLHDEVTAFLEFYETVARTRTVTVMFLSNAITFTNPYFLYFNIIMPYGKNISARKDILIEMVVDEEFMELKKNTRFAKMIEGTLYYEYAIENKFLRDNYDFVEKRTAGCKPMFTMHYKELNLGVWTDYKAGLMFVSEKPEPSCRVTYAMTLADHTPNTLLLKGRKSRTVETFFNAYKLGIVRFETIKVKNLCDEILRLTL